MKRVKNSFLLIVFLIFTGCGSALYKEVRGVDVFDVYFKTDKTEVDSWSGRTLGINDNNKLIVQYVNVDDKRNIIHYCILEGYERRIGKLLIDKEIIYIVKTNYIFESEEVSN